jgi:hypothetical protein
MSSDAAKVRHMVSALGDKIRASDAVLKRQEIAMHYTDCKE